MNIPVFAHVAAASSMLPAAAGLWYWKSLSRPLKVFALFCIYALLHVIAEFILGRFGISNLFLINFYHWVELVCVLWIYRAWTSNIRMKDAFQYFAIFYTLVWILNKVYFEDPFHFSEITLSISMLVELIASVMVLNALVRNTTIAVARHSIFWIASGVLLCCSGTIIILAISNTIMSLGQDYFDIMWHINWGFTIISNFMYARSFLCKIF
ncbi:MAG: hypothetical protein WCW35_11420 [Bacteroidota bacterium]|jgi:hypothetical protein